MFLTGTLLRKYSITFVRTWIERLRNSGIRALRDCGVLIRPHPGNAQPWADVWVNGEKQGETPIGNITVPIGTHEVVFRQPRDKVRKRVVFITQFGDYRFFIHSSSHYQR